MINVPACKLICIVNCECLVNFNNFRLKAKVSGSSGFSDNCNHNLIYWKQVNALLVIGLPFHVIDPQTLETLSSVSHVTYTHASAMHV